jgi:hypothetical protein
VVSQRQRDIETAMQRRGTKEFISADPRDIVLVRIPLVDNGTGGSTEGTPVPLAAQTMRLIPFNSQVSAERQLPDGRVVHPSWTLMAEVGANILYGDTFDLPDGTTGEVIYVQEKTVYQVKAEVVSRGPR